MSSNNSLPPLPLGPAPKRATRQATVAWKTNIITVGGDAPVRVQSMTNTDTADVIATAIQVKDLARAGSEIVRLTVDTPAAAAAVPFSTLRRAVVFWVSVIESLLGFCQRQEWELRFLCFADIARGGFALGRTLRPPKFVSLGTARFYTEPQIDRALQL